LFRLTFILGQIRKSSEKVEAKIDFMERRAHPCCGAGGLIDPEDPFSPDFSFSLNYQFDGCQKSYDGFQFVLAGVLIS